MLVIRFSNTGRRGERKYKLVLSEKRSRKEGRPVEVFGFYEKRAKGIVAENINRERVEYWLSKGAQLAHGAKRALEAKQA
jgi:small subunit ribosomal protein S16